MNQLECQKCEHVWTPIVEKPLRCPNCNQPKYWLPRVRPVALDEDKRAKPENRQEEGE
jgi:Zn finger protein HypA/HybF involved in hydrogenase expression